MDSELSVSQFTQAFYILCQSLNHFGYTNTISCKIYHTRMYRRSTPFVIEHINCSIIKHILNKDERKTMKISLFLYNF